MLFFKNRVITDKIMVYAKNTSKLEYFRNENIEIIKKDYFDLDNSFWKFYEECRKYTMTSLERMYANFKAIEYITSNKIEGSIVECGVWQGGSTMIMLKGLLHFNSDLKDIYLYDTFDGMSKPTAEDKKTGSNISAIEKWTQMDKITHNDWCYASLETVKENIALTKYPTTNIKYIKGKVEDTIPHHIPQKIALLRLDTDWYASTLHELEHLFPRLVKGGILIIDDYGTWEGAKKAVDEYFKKNNIKPFLHRIDITGRLLIKQ